MQRNVRLTVNGQDKRTKSSTCESQGDSRTEIEGRDGAVEVSSSRGLILVGYERADESPVRARLGHKIPEIEVEQN